jgi:acyl-CoA synthetase (NDP forming)/RimJ/RimL family protein N-acetyltransferase
MAAMIDLDLPDNYPVEWEADVVLRDGTVAHVRPMIPSDGDGVRRFHLGQSEESIYLRFFAPIKQLSDKDVHRFTHVDYDERVALVVTIRGEIIGIARYDRLPEPDPTTAEVAFNISDHFHGKGVGSVLLEHLAAIGREAGVTKFIADVLPQNRKMMKVFADAGYEVEHHFDDGVIAVSFQIEPTEKSQAVQLAREHRAEAQSMRALLTPSSIAVVGVSRRPDAIGSLVLNNILDGGFTGEVYVVNTEADTVRGLRAHARVADIGAPVDMAVIAVPAQAVSEVVVDCANAGVRTLVVVSSGFAEAGPQGEYRQAELLRVARDSGMRVVGPSSFGLVNNNAEVRLNATIARRLPNAGGLGLFSQSGGLGIALLDAAAQRRLGLSIFASAGNRVDVSGNDFMQYWIDDDDTHVVGLYMESIGNPRKFSRIARQLSLRKPVVAVKARTSGNVPPGHRARQTRVDPKAFDTLLEQAGVIRAGNIRELINVAELASRQPLPTGNRLAVVGNSDGMNAIIIDAAQQLGLQVPRPAFRVPTGGSAIEVADGLERALSDDGIDSVSVCFTPPMGASDEDIASAIAHTSSGYGKPIVATFVGMRDMRPVLLKAGEFANPAGGTRIVPTYSSALDGVRALAGVTKYALWRSSDHGERVRPEGVDRVAAEAIVEQVLADSPDGRALTSVEAQRLLATHGVSLWSMVSVSDAEEAVAAAESIGYPVVLKSMSEEARRIPVASVRTDLSNPTSVREAYASLAARLGQDGAPDLVVQKMASLGVATVLETHEDPLFGPVVSFGLAGPPSALLGDVSYAIPPLTDVDVTSLITSLRAAPLLQGYRGATPLDLTMLEDLIARVAVLAEDLPDVDHVQLTPVNVHAGGVDVLGGLVHVSPAGVRTDAGKRALG